MRTGAIGQIWMTNSTENRKEIRTRTHKVKKKISIGGWQHLSLLVNSKNSCSFCPCFSVSQCPKLQNRIICAYIQLCMTSIFRTLWFDTEAVQSAMSHVTIHRKCTEPPHSRVGTPPPRGPQKSLQGKYIADVVNTK